MGLFTSSKSWGAQMKGAKGVKTGKQAREEAAGKDKRTEYKKRRDAARGKK